MDNLEDKSKGNTNSAGESHQDPSDPIVQARDDSSRSSEGIQPTEIIHSAKKSISAANETLLLDRTLGSGQQMQGISSAMALLMSILRFKWTMLTVFVLVTAPMIAAIWTQVLPKYNASAALEARRSIPALVYDTEETGSVPGYVTFVNTQIAMMKSPQVLEKVLVKQEVRQTQWYKRPHTLLQRLRGISNDPMKRLKIGISVKERRRTDIIDLTFQDTSAKDAKLILDTVLDEYIRFYEETTDATRTKLYRQLQDEYKSLENEILGREKTIAELQRSLGTQDPQNLITLRRLRIDQTQARLDQLRYTIAVLEKLADSNDVALASTDTQKPKYYEDVEWQRLDLSVRTMRYQIANSHLTPKHPRMVNKLKDLEFQEEQLRLREAELDEQWRNRPKNLSGVPTTIAQGRNQATNVLGVPIATTDVNTPSLEQDLVLFTPLDSLQVNVPVAPVITNYTSTPGLAQGFVSVEQELAQAKQQKQFLLEEVKIQQEDFKRLFEITELLNREQKAIARTRGLFNAVQERLDRKNMERNAPGVMAILQRASVPSEPDIDPRKVFTAMVLVLGLGMGGGVAFLRATRNQAVYTPKDMPHPMQVPFLGYIPVARTRRSLDLKEDNLSRRAIMAARELAFTEVDPAVIESIRFVRTTFLSRVDGQGSSTVLVSSANAGTGKTTFTMMLGKSLAQIGKKVLIIDVDFHKTTLTKRFNLSDKPGFTESLCCRSVDKRHIFPMETSGLSFIPAGNRGDDGAVCEETANGAFKTCIDELRRQYDIILFDSPPILPLADTIILSSQVDGTIIVERELVSRRVNITNALDRLSSTGGRLLGTVFIGSSSHEEYGYSYYYSKASESKKSI